jgi:hypothetical protein
MQKSSLNLIFVTSLTFLLLFLGLATALDYEPYLYYTQGNAGIQRLGTSDNTFLTSPYPNKQNISEANFSECSMAESKYNILSDDIDGDLFPDFIVTTDNDIRVYSSDCILKSIFTFSSTAPPMLTDMNENGINEIVLTNSTGIYFAEYDNSMPNYAIIKSVLFYNNITNDKRYTLCTRYESADDEKFCIVMNTTSNLGKSINKIHMGTWTTNDWGTFTPTFSSRMINETSSGWGTTLLHTSYKGNPFILQIAEDNKYKFGLIEYYHLVTGANDDGYLHIYNADLTDYLYKDILFSAGFVGSGAETMSMLMFVQDASQNWFTAINIMSPVTSLFIFNGIYSFTGNAIFREHSGAGSGGLPNVTYCKSPWIYNNLIKSFPDKVLYCIFANSSSNMTLKTFSSNAFSYQYNYTLNNQKFFEYGDSCAVADFNTSAVTYGFTCTNGLYGAYPTDLNSNVPLFINNTAQKITDRLTLRQNLHAPTIVQDWGLTQKPFFVFSGETASYILTMEAPQDKCGNGVCDFDENDFSCAIDCDISNVTTTTTVTGSDCCQSASDCSGIYDACYAGSCVSGLSLVTCTNHYQCPTFTAPLCIGVTSTGSGRCVKTIQSVCNTSTVFVGDITTTSNTSSTGNAQQDIFNTWQILFGNNAWLRYFVGIIILISTIWGAYSTMHQPSPIVVGMIGIIMMIFLTMIGLLPIWIAIIIGILLFFMFYTSMNKQTGG